MHPEPTSFDFTEFARDIYRECAFAHPTPYLLPALYGGEAGVTYDAMFVLQDPSVQFTVANWSPCETVEAAIQAHRRIFLSWAFSKSYPSLLFGALGTTMTEFFKRFYITDVWKDAGFQMRGKDPAYKGYWRSKLIAELNGVPTRRIITVGSVPRKEVGQLKRQGLVPKGTPIHHVSFPSPEQRGITQEGYKQEVGRFIEEMKMTG